MQRVEGKFGRDSSFCQASLNDHILLPNNSKQATNRWGMISNRLNVHVGRQERQKALVSNQYSRGIFITSEWKEIHINLDRLPPKCQVLFQAFIKII